MPPTLNSSIATRNDQKYITRPQPRGYSIDGGRLACRMPISSKPWLAQSANECTASASMAPEPVMTAAISLAIKIAKLAPSASRIALSELECPDIVRSLADTDAYAHTEIDLAALHLRCRPDVRLSHADQRKDIAGFADL